MSVINKMLRDLDSRQAAAAVISSSASARSGIVRDTLIVKAAEPTLRKSRWLAAVLAALAVLMVMAVGAWWYVNHSLEKSRERVGVSAVTTVLPVKTPSSAPTTPLADPPSTSLPIMATTASQTGFAALADLSLRIDSNLKAPLVPEKAVPSKSSKSGARLVPRALPAPSPSQPTVSAEKPTQPVSVATPTSAATFLTGLPSQSAVQQALAQAQKLWNSGSRHAAIDLLNLALASVERSKLGDAATGNNALLASLARELSLMELAEGKVRQSLERLIRLEPALSGVADIWAIRGNAAQRLGRHVESVTAYQTALSLRPDEPRWLLGAAVSLAAQGQTAAAAELAEKARAGGVLSAEVATYLHQLGVILPN